MSISKPVDPGISKAHARGTCRPRFRRNTGDGAKAVAALLNLHLPTCLKTFGQTLGRSQSHTGVHAGRHSFFSLRWPQRMPETRQTLLKTCGEKIIFAVVVPASVIKKTKISDKAATFDKVRWHSVEISKGGDAWKKKGGRGTSTTYLWQAGSATKQPTGAPKRRDARASPMQTEQSSD